jgi:predicted lysophospholipase L1 biosynthesis ABC-type transport system permease subunit
MLGLGVGDTLALRHSTTGAPARIRVTGLFRVRDPRDPYWRLSLLGTSGAVAQGSFVTYGPMLVHPAALGPGGLTTGGASWLIRADTARIPPAGITALRQRLAGAISSLEGAQRLGGLQVTTRLPQTLSALACSLVVSRSLVLIGLLELILLALVAVALAARLLATQREEETSLLSARGVARRQLALASLAEATLLAVTGAAAGAVLGSYAASALVSASGLPAVGTAGLAAPCARAPARVSGGWPRSSRCSPSSS